MKVIRLFSLMDVLRGRTRPVTAEALALMLSVSCRTIYRDIATLQAMGAPIAGEAGIGYQLAGGYFLPPLNLTVDEMEAIVLGAALVAQRADDGLAAAARSARAKITAGLPEAVRANYAAAPLLAHSRRNTDTVAARWLTLLRRAILERRRLSMSYLDLSGHLSERTVRPLGLTVFDQAWLLTGWCEMRNDFRNFRLDFVQALSLTGDCFRQERGKGFYDYLRSLTPPSLDA
jgi:predicted DNA-binding transcriptional regulator YafY